MFKPNTDDMRDAPPIPLITALQDIGAVVNVFGDHGHSVIVDLRNIYSPDEVSRSGILYCGVGRPQPVADGFP